MSDAFGGILDDMRGVVTDASSFFDNALGSAVARGIAGAAPSQEGNSALGYGNTRAHALEAANSLSKMDNVPMDRRYSPASDSGFKEAQSVNFEQVEQSWLQRLHRFSQIDEGLQAGKINEGQDR